MFHDELEEDDVQRSPDEAAEAGWQGVGGVDDDDAGEISQVSRR